MNRLVVLGAPSSAGAYAPGQEKAPAAMRAAGLLSMLQDRGIPVHDGGDAMGFRWRADKAHPQAMNVDAVAAVAGDVSRRVAVALQAGDGVLVLGGDCTVEIGTVAGAVSAGGRVGLVYVDLDTDLNTPLTTTDGAFDWMGVAHMLAVPGSVGKLSGIGPRIPLLQADQLLFFGIDNVEPCERKLMEELQLREVRLAQVAADPSGSAAEVASGWARQFDRLLVHLDVDIVDFADTPLAENTRRHVGLRFDQLIPALGALLRAPNFCALTVCELNPDHGEGDGSTLANFSEALADCFAGSGHW